ncbi:flagellar hook-basal body complex protein FliE [Microbulbifer rhizosphaerae]|uniref:Flagellar hook-basal body complex protein FliE n=1 Tax=Microbulbifer rhizosphaerae TaxID=1562603 RepID=A0A7W4ZCM4_9GAMM|nr:flagellar hook-basal body complex protein FliE [Microbulbifer rhizosphaerae]MBB3063490.1 flagellar hook-basal body complex protein FliE [Microbulbifer rhizosphaerae]
MEVDAISSWPVLSPIDNSSLSIGRSSPVFESIMSELNAVDQQYKSAEKETLELITGELDNVHQVMASINKAKLSFELVTQVRNKILEGYQEVMRMQI